MRVATVESTTLAAVGYDENLKRLQLEFCSRAVYLYFGVPAPVVEALLDALVEFAAHRPALAAVFFLLSSAHLPLYLGGELPRYRQDR